VNTVRRWQDKYGSYQLTANDQFIESVIIGAIGDDITRRFRKDICELAMSYSGRPFGYLADLRASEGYTENAQRTIEEAYKSCLQLGCVIDALMIDSALVKSQMQAVNDAIDISLPLEIRLFNDRDKAIAFIEKVIKKSSGA